MKVGRGGEASIPVSDKEASELEELLQLFELGLGETQAFAAALQVTWNCCRCCLTCGGLQVEVVESVNRPESQQDLLYPTASSSLVSFLCQ